jgi:uncharacterized protein YkwD
MGRGNALAATGAALLCVGLLTATASAQADGDPKVARALELTNTERRNNGVRPLALSSELSRAAQAYSQVLATTGCFAHTCGPIPDLAERLERTGYNDWQAIAENIAGGYETPEAAMRGWMNSPGHRKNILSPMFTEIGLGLAKGGGEFGIYWTQNFGVRFRAPGAPWVAIPQPELEVEAESGAEPALDSVPDEAE